MITISVLITGDKPTPSEYDRWIVYKSSTKAGTYSKINGSTGQLISDMTYLDESGISTDWYKVSYYNNSTTNESTLSVAMQGLSTTYASVRKVQDFLRLPTLSDTTNPTIQEIVDLINRKEDILDHKTGHAWRTRYCGTTSGQDQTAKYEYYDIDSLYEFQTGRPIYLKHRKIKTFDSDKGDAFEIWNGSSWADWLSERTEGRSEDYWLDYEMGMLNIKARFGVVGPVKIRLKYRYGEIIVNKIVEDICIKMCAIDLLLGESRGAFVPEGSNSALSYGRKIDIMQKDIDYNLSTIREMQIPNLMR